MENEVGMTILWALEQDDFEESDYIWCRGLGVKIDVTPLFGNIYIQGKCVDQIVRGLRIRLTTFCKRQESMLKLKYGVHLIELHRANLIPHEELQGLDWEKINENSNSST